MGSLCRARVAGAGGENPELLRCPRTGLCRSQTFRGSGVPTVGRPRSALQAGAGVESPTSLRRPGREISRFETVGNFGKNQKLFSRISETLYLANQASQRRGKKIVGYVAAPAFP